MPRKGDLVSYVDTGRVVAVTEMGYLVVDFKLDQTPTAVRPEEVVQVDTH